MGFFDKLFQKKALNMGQFIPTWLVNQPIWKEWDYSNAVKEGFKKNSLVYSCIDKIAKSASSVEWHVYKKRSDGTYEIIQDHPLEKLINNPNPYMSKRDFITRWTYSMFLGGNSIFFKVRGQETQPPIELWYLPQDTVSPVPSKTTFIDRYVYDYDGIKKDIKPRDIIHDRFIDPMNIYWGISPIKSASMLIDSDNQAVEWNKFSMSQRAISDGAFIIDQPLTKDQWTDINYQIEQNHTGPENARKFWVLGAGAKWQQMSLSPVEMDFIQSKKLNREDICAIFGVPPGMVGYYENATLANIETARKIFWLDTIVPYLTGIRDALNSSLTVEYGDVYLDYDLSTVDALQVNIADKIQNATSLFAMGVPFNEINTLLDIGLDNIEGGDVGFISSSLKPVEQVLEPPQELNNGPLTEQDEDNPQQEDTESPPQDDNSQKNTNIPEHFKNFLENDLNKTDVAYLNMKDSPKDSFESTLSFKIAKLFDKMSKALESDPKGYEKILKKFDKDWEDLLYDNSLTILKDVGRKEYDQLLRHSKGFTPIEETKFNIFEALLDKTILTWIKSSSAEKVVGIQKTTKKRLAKVIHDIEESYQKQGKRAPLDEMAKAIKEKFKSFSRYRSYVIARTEVASAVESASFQGSHLAQQQIDPTGKKLVVKRKWLSAHDKRVRHTHNEANGQVRGLEEKFNVGKAELMYPGEYEAGFGEETINCRCTTTSFVERVD